jgi:hypothetical protein
VARGQRGRDEQEDRGEPERDGAAAPGALGPFPAQGGTAGRAPAAVDAVQVTLGHGRVELEVAQLVAELLGHGEQGRELLGHLVGVPFE